MILRRVRSIPLVLIAFVVVTVLLIPLLAVAIVADLLRLAITRCPPTITRLALILWCWLFAETVGMTALLVIWVVSAFGRNVGRLQRQTFAVQQSWAAWMLGAARILFRLRIEVEGSAIAQPGPYLLFVRHVSILDNLLPAAVISRPFWINLRYVLKRELLADPCFDIAGQRLPNYFVERDSGDPAGLQRVRDLTVGLGDHDGVLIYPEGTRVTAERRARALERIAKRDPQRAERLAVLEHCLPPRTGGPLALFGAAPELDIVLLMHAGLDGLKGIGDVLGGALVRRRIVVRVERYERASIPAGPATADWLDQRWIEIDRWVGSTLAGIGAEG